MTWILKGYDTFEERFYALSGEYPSQQEAERAAEAKLKEIEGTQPTVSTGEQEEDGIQDQIFVVRPDGTQYRYTGNPSPVGSQ